MKAGCQGVEAGGCAKWRATGAAVRVKQAALRLRLASRLWSRSPAPSIGPCQLYAARGGEVGAAAGAGAGAVQRAGAPGKLRLLNSACGLQRIAWAAAYFGVVAAALIALHACLSNLLA